jgi:ComF family protein
MLSIREYLRDFSHLAFPFNCYGCNKALDSHELPVCDDCREGLPVTRYWEYDDNTVKKLFWGKITLEHACAFTFFTKGGIIQHLIHELKYKGKTRVGELMGNFFAERLKGTVYESVDVVVPVPLHSKRLRSRGYNQCDYIAGGIATSMGKSYNLSVVQRLRANETQTKKGVYDRWINVQELFRVHGPQFVKDKHVLLVDDVVTTGSTLEACAGAILQVPGTRVSVAALACPSPI